MEKGREEGIEKGKSELRRNMLKLGTPIDTIVKANNISVEELKIFLKEY